jgi:hypothetical protein
LLAMDWDDRARCWILSEKIEASMASVRPAIPAILKSGDFVCMEFLLSCFFLE